MTLREVSTHHVGIPEELEPRPSEFTVAAGTLTQAAYGRPVLGGAAPGRLLPAQLEGNVLRPYRKDQEALEGARQPGALAAKLHRWRRRARITSDGSGHIGNFDRTNACSFHAPPAYWFTVRVVLDRADEPEGPGVVGGRQSFSVKLDRGRSGNRKRQLRERLARVEHNAGQPPDDPHAIGHTSQTDP
jgi:hypothetical protein